MTCSVVTPSFNQSNWLQLCLASVADQAVPVEHLVQDAGSTDGTLDWLQKDARVQAAVEKDEGMYDGVNRGLRRASGEILAYLNCDEQYLPGTLASVLEFFQAHPEIEVVFSDAVVVDPEGNYLWHRKTLLPLPYHTAVCPLSTLTCATFFRRSILETRRLWFDPAWRFCGDGAWVAQLLQQKVRMAVMRRFVSVFTHTTENLSLDPKAQEEARRYYDQAPGPARLFKPLVLVHHRLRRWLGGVYRQKPFSFALYTQTSPNNRVTRTVTHPTARWRW